MMLNNIRKIIKEELNKVLNEYNPLEKIKVDASDFNIFRGVSKDEFNVILKQKHLIPSSDLMPLDWDVVEYGLGDDASEMSEEEIEQWIKDTCRWYNGTVSSIKGGVNLTNDIETAEGYGDFVLAVDCNCQIAEFSDSHLFAKDATKCVPVAYKEYGSYDWFKID